MAGKNNKKGRGAGGSQSGATAVAQPPKPSGMKVNQFQEASRDAQQRKGRAVQRRAKRWSGLQTQPQREMASDDGGRRNIKGLAKIQRADALDRGTVRPERLNRSGGQKPGFRAPATRLY